MPITYRKGIVLVQAETGNYFLTSYYRYFKEENCINSNKTYVTEKQN